MKPTQCEVGLSFSHGLLRTGPPHRGKVSRSAWAWAMVVRVSTDVWSVDVGAGATWRAPAARLVDHVLPEQPVRQWVLALPWSLRGLVAVRGEVLNAVAKVFVEEVFRWQREQVARALQFTDLEDGTRHSLFSGRPESPAFPNHDLSLRVEPRTHDTQAPKSPRTALAAVHHRSTGRPCSNAFTKSTCSAVRAAARSAWSHSSPSPSPCATSSSPWASTRLRPPERHQGGCREPISRTEPIRTRREAPRRPSFWRQNYASIFERP
jgi:hypothetical protein